MPRYLLLCYKISSIHLFIYALHNFAINCLWENGWHELIFTKSAKYFFLSLFCYLSLFPWFNVGNYLNMLNGIVQGYVILLKTCVISQLLAILWSFIPPAIIKSVCTFKIRLTAIGNIDRNFWSSKIIYLKCGPTIRMNSDYRIGWSNRQMT